MAVRLPAAGCATVFLFDWDDTLMPSSALRRSKPCTNLRLQAALRKVDLHAAQVLTFALSVPGGRVILLTNACREWVKTSSAEHLPEVHALLKKAGRKVSLVSAYRPMPAGIDASTHAMMSQGWKDEAVRNLAGVLMQSFGEVHLLQVVSVGDMPHDLEAGRTLAGLFASAGPRCYAKTVRMQISPTVPELAGQLCALAKLLPAVCEKPRDLACGMERTALPESDGPCASGISRPDGPAEEKAAKTQSARSNDSNTGTLALESLVESCVTTEAAASCVAAAVAA